MPPALPDMEKPVLGLLRLLQGQLLEQLRPQVPWA